MSAAVFDQGVWSDASSGTSIVSVAAAGPGVYVAALTLPGALASGDSFTLAWRDSLDAGATNAHLWEADLVDSSTDPALGIVSPPVPILDPSWGKLVVFQTIAVGPIEFSWVIYKVAELTV